MEVDKSVADAVTEVEYKEKVLQDDQMNRHQRVKIFDDNELQTDWRENVKVVER